MAAAGASVLSGLLIVGLAVAVAIVVGLLINWLMPADDEEWG